MATDLSNLDNLLGGIKHKSITKPVCDSLMPSTPESIISTAKKNKIETSPLDIESVIKIIFNIKISKVDLGKSASGFLEKINDSWYIYINSQESIYRQRFTMAHELAHYILHRANYISNGPRKEDRVFFRDENTNTYEREANDFAAKLLLPEAEFKEAIKHGNNTILKLANYFNLSTAAIRYRAYKLGLISKY